MYAKSLKKAKDKGASLGMYHQLVEHMQKPEDMPLSICNRKKDDKGLSFMNEDKIRCEMTTRSCCVHISILKQLMIIP